MSHRIERVNSVIRQEISNLLQRQVKDPRLGAFISITQVVTSPDLKSAKLYVSFLGSPEEKQGALSALTGAAGFLRRELAKNLKLRRIPELSFHWDDSIEQGDHIMRLFDQISSPKVNKTHSS